jgi:acyl-ACP thioesterase
MLSRFLVRVGRYPEPQQTLTATTWPSGVARLFALREFRLTSGGRTALAVATSGWLLIDLAARRPVRPDSLIAGLPIAERVLDVTFGKLDGAFAPAWTLEHAVRPEDIDVNGHVTNTAYIGWMEEGVRDRLPAGQGIAEMEIHFLAEVFRDDRVRVEGEDPSRATTGCALRVVREADASVAARAIVRCDGVQSGLPVA